MNTTFYDQSWNTIIYNIENIFKYKLSVKILLCTVKSYEKCSKLSKNIKNMIPDAYSMGDLGDVMKVYWVGKTKNLKKWI